MFYHFPEPDTLIPYCHTEEEAQAVLSRGRPDELHLRLTGLTPGAQGSIEILDRDHGWAWSAWKAIGAPEPPDRDQTAWLRTVARATARRRLRVDPTGQLELRLTLNPWDVVFLTIENGRRQPLEANA